MEGKVQAVGLTLIDSRRVIFDTLPSVGAVGAITQAKKQFLKVFQADMKGSFFTASVVQAFCSTLLHTSLKNVQLHLLLGFLKSSFSFLSLEHIYTTYH